MRSTAPPASLVVVSGMFSLTLISDEHGVSYSGPNSSSRHSGWIVMNALGLEGETVAFPVIPHAAALADG